MGCSGNGSGVIDHVSACPNLDGGVLSWLGNHTDTASFALKGRRHVGGKLGFFFSTSTRIFHFGVILHAMLGV